jgi:hypothetical protein
MGMNGAARTQNFPAPFLLRNRKVGLPSYNPSAAAAAALGLRFESKSGAELLEDFVAIQPHLSLCAAGCVTRVALFS